MCPSSAHNKIYMVDFHSTQGKFILSSELFLKPKLSYSEIVLKDLSTGIL